MRLCAPCCAATRAIGGSACTLGERRGECTGGAARKGRPLNRKEKRGARRGRAKAKGESGTHAAHRVYCQCGTKPQAELVVMSAPVADDEVGTMSAVSSESDAAMAAPSKNGRGGKGEGGKKDRAAPPAAASGRDGEGEEEEGGSNSGGGESSDGDGGSSDEGDVRGRFSGCFWLNLCVVDVFTQRVLF